MTEDEKTTAQEAKRAKTEQALKDLEQMVESMTPADYAAFLEKVVSNGMWRYSSNNLLLIGHQLPDATRVASYKAWQKQGRQVRKGEKGAVILRPLISNQTMRDDNGQPVLDDKGKPKKQKVVIQGQFGLGSVFDISQTEPIPGKEVPLDDETRRGSTQCIEDMTRVAEKHGVKVFRGGVEDKDFPYGWLLNGQLLRNPNAGGYYLRAEVPGDDGEPQQLQVIVTRKGLSPQEEARVVSHELGHAVMHSDAKDLDHPIKEVEAESVGYALCSHYGVETNHSAAYLLNWAKSRKEPTKELKASMERIRRAVMEIMEARDGEASE